MKLFILLLTLLATINSQAKTLEIYFDTPELFLLKNNSSIKYQAVKYILKTTDSDTSYKQLFKKQIKEDNLFSVKFEYPYLVNLSYAMMMAIVGLSLIFLLFRRRLF